MTPTIPLKYPLEIEGGLVTSLTFKRAKIKNLQAIQKAAEDGDELLATIVTISELTGLSLDAVREIDAEDLIELAGKVADFLPKVPTSLKVGEGS